MTKTFLRTLLAGLAAAGVAAAQTPPPRLSPTSTPPAPAKAAAAAVLQVAFKQEMPQPVPPAWANDSPLVRVDVRLVTLPVGNAAVKDLFPAKPKPVSLTADQLLAFLERVSGDRQGSVLQAPRMSHPDRQPMDFRVGDDRPFDTGRGPVRVFIGTTCRMTPTLVNDGKAVDLAVDLAHTERNGGAESDVRNLTTLAVKETFRLPVGGTTAVRLGTRTVTRAVEVPAVLSGIPYLIRPAVKPDEVASDVVALFTVERVGPADDEPRYPVAKLDKPAPPRVVTKVFEVADLVCPPTDSPLANPGADVALRAAAAAYLKARPVQLKNALRGTANAASWEEYGGSWRMDFYDLGQALVVSAPAEVVAQVGERLDELRRANAPHVFVEMLVFQAASDHPALAKLFGKGREAAVPKEELTKLVHELKAEGALDVLSRPHLMLTDKQTGFFQCGQHYPRLTGTTAPGGQNVQQVEYINTGLVVRLTPDCVADGRSMRVRVEASLTEPSPALVDLGNGVKAQPIDCQSIEADLKVPDGGTMVVNLGTKKAEQRIESKVPVLGDLPYLGRLFRNVGIRHERRDTIVVFTATRVKNEAELQQLIRRQSANIPPGTHAAAAPTPVPAVVPPLPVQRVNGSPLPPNAVPVAPPVVREVRGERIEILLNDDFVSRPIGVQRGGPEPRTLPAAVPPLGANWHSQVTPIRMPIHNPYAQIPPMIPQHIRTTGPDGLERIGVDFNRLIPASGSVPVTGTVQGGLSGDASVLMAAYRAACAAGRKDEAARLAVQLLAKDPTCFGWDN